MQPEREVAVAVINDELINLSICKENISSENANAINEDGTANFSCIQTLVLSYKNIFKLDNLVTLNKLTKLKLDNNVIQKIDGIGHLTNLTWLDLSFNNIDVIEGLNTLTNLTDLTLFNNNISKLENLHMLTKLQVFSIGNNNLSSTDGLLYLRALENLKVLNLEGNPVCSDPEYRTFVLAHLDKLKYLDYSMVETTEVTLAREQYQDELEEFKEKKILDDATKKREHDMEAYTQMLKEANIYIIETLFIDMFKEDTEFIKIQALPGLQNLKDDYSDKVKSFTENSKNSLLEQHKELQEASKTYQSVYQKGLSSAQAKSIDLHEAYRRQTKRQFQGITEGPSDPHVAKCEAQNRCEKLIEQLMIQESDLVEQSQELLNTFEAKVETLGSTIHEISTDHFRAVEEFENNFHESVSQLAAHLLERLSAEDADDDDLLSDECRVLLNDRDALTSAISSGHDIHIGKLLSQEDVKREQGKAQLLNVVNNFKDKEWSRNRARVAEIIQMREKHLNDINDLVGSLTARDDN